MNSMGRKKINLVGHVTDLIILMTIHTALVRVKTRREHMCYI